MSDKPARPPVNYIYVAELGLISLLLAIVGWFSVATVTDVKASVSDLVRTTGEMKGEIRSMRATMDGWAQQNFVPRDLFDTLRERVAALERGK